MTNMTNQTEPILSMMTIDQVTAKYNLSKYFVRTVVHSGKIRVVRCGTKKILINEQSLIDYFNAGDEVA